MRIYKHKGQIVQVGAPFELEGIAYPWNWFDLASADDLKQHGFTVEEVPDVVPVPPTISDRQFFQQLAIENIISQDDALAAVKVGAVPAALSALIDSLPSDQKFGAEMLVSGATVFERAHPLTIVIGEAYGWDGARMDDFWRAAAAL